MEEEKMETDITLTQFMMFENNSNVCWLNSSLTLIAHSKAIGKIAECFPDSKLNQIIVMYNEAMSALKDINSPNDMENSVKTCKKKLLSIQTSMLQYLQPILKYEAGEPDSAFCALLNLMYENKAIKDHLSISWSWKKHCRNCGITSSSSPKPKPIITLPKANAFVPDCPTSIYSCSCKTEQVMKLVYKQLPPCLIFHFEQGAGNGDNLPTFFTVKDRKYSLTCVIVLEKGKTASFNHFVTYIRDPLLEKWLECNDLNMDVISFSSEVPQFSMRDVYIFVFESSDNSGKLNNGPIEHSQEHDSECSVELIDISDESGGLNTELHTKSTFPDTLTNVEKSVSNLTIQDSLRHSNQAMCEEKKVVPKAESGVISAKNLKIADDKSRSDVPVNGVCANKKEMQKSNVSKFKYAVSDVRFFESDEQINKNFLMKPTGLDNKTKVENEPKTSEIKTDRSHNDSSKFRNALRKDNSVSSSNIKVPKQEPRSSSENSFINRDKIKNKPKTSQVKTKASHSDTPEFKSYFKKSKKGDSVLSGSNVDISKQRCSSAPENFFLCKDDVECKPKTFTIETEVSCKESSKFEKCATLDLASKKPQKLLSADLLESFVKSNSKFNNSDTNSKLNVNRELCCSKKNCSCDKVKNQCFSKRKGDNSAKKIIVSGEQLHEKSAEGSSLEMLDRQTIPKTMAYSKMQENKAIDNDGQELQSRIMQHETLKRGDSQFDCTNTNLSKASEEKSLSQIKLGHKCRLQESDIGICQDLSDVKLEGDNPESCKAFPLDGSVAVNPKRNSPKKSSRNADSKSPRSDSSKNISSGASFKKPTTSSASSKSSSAKHSSKSARAEEELRELKRIVYADVEKAYIQFLKLGL